MVWAGDEIKLKLHPLFGLPDAPGQSQPT
jgi:hypothetical protein